MFQSSDNLSWTPLFERQILMLPQFYIPFKYLSFLNCNNEAHDAIKSQTNPAKSGGLILPDNFYSNIIEGTNQQLNETIRAGALEPEIKLLDLQELKKLFGMICLMEQYNFPNYKEHFEVNPKFFKSPILKLMGHQRFKTLLSKISLKMDDSKLQTIENLLHFYQRKGIVAEEYLFLKRKIIPQSSFSIILLYDETGIFLNGILLNINERLDENSLRSLLNDHKDMNHTLILTENLCDMKCIMFLKSLQIKVLGYSSNDEFNVMMQPDTNYKNLFFFNGKLIVSRSFNETTHVFCYFFTNSLTFYNQAIKKSLDLQGLEKIKTVYNVIKGNFNFPIRKEIEKDFIGSLLQNDLKLILFLFKTAINNTYISIKNIDMNFNGFMKNTVKDLLPRSDGNEKVKKLIITKRRRNPIGHYPEKMQTWCKKCRVCLKEGGKIKKTKYKCMKCSRHGKDVPLCISPCFQIYHDNIAKYSKKKKFTRLY